MCFSTLSKSGNIGCFSNIEYRSKNTRYIECRMKIAENIKHR